MDGLNRFKQCAAAYGAGRRRWPRAERALYDAHAQTEEGREILAQAERTDRFLDVWQVGAPDEALRSKIVSLAGEAWRRGAPAPRAIWWSITGFAASAALGFMLGFAQVRDDASIELAAGLVFGPASTQEIGL